MKSSEQRSKRIYETSPILVLLFDLQTDGCTSCIVVVVLFFNCSLSFSPFIIVSPFLSLLLLLLLFVFS